MSHHQRNTYLGRRILERGKTFCLQTSLHGFAHTAVPGRHWTERLLWMGIIAVAVWGVVSISMGQLQRFMENPTVVTLEKDFRTWKYTLPAITVCDQNKVNNVSLSKTIQSLWNIHTSDHTYEYYSRFVATVANSDLYHLQHYEEFRHDAALNVDLYQVALKVMQELQVQTVSSEKITPKWSPVMTEAGICYTINSVAIADISIKSADNDTFLLPYTCSYSAQGCYLRFETNKVIDYYVHSPYDIADVVAGPSNIYPTLFRFTELSSMETRAGRGVRELPPQRRRCLYTDEPTSSGKKVYSTSTCRLSCRSQLSVQLCGCKPFYYFYEGFTVQEPMCSPAGMWCLAAHAHQLATLSGLKCPCSQQCVDSIYREVSNDDHIMGKGPFEFLGAVRITVRAPRTRYNREIVFHFQDLVVSFGGAAGLFLGASLISFVEIIYFLIESIFNAENSQRKKTAVIMPRPYEDRIQKLTAVLAGNALENRMN